MLSKDTRILLVDDVPDMCMVLRNQLKSLGYESVLTAESGEDALKLIHQQARVGEPVQLLLTDWNMTGISGMELLTRLRADPRYSNLPVLMITFESEPDQALKAMRQGVTDYLIKPFEKDALREKLESTWKNRS